MKFDFFTGKLAIAYDMDLDDATISKLVSLAIEAAAMADTFYLLRKAAENEHVSN